MTPCLSLLCFMVFGPPGLVLGEPATPPAASTAPASSIQAYGSHNQCLAWTDGCVICTGKAGPRASTGPATGTQDTDQAQCSTPGIACTPGAARCTQPGP